MPRKSAASTSAAPTSPTTAQAGDTSILSHATEPKSPTTKSAKKQQDDSLGIDDLLLPRSLTSRIARGILPANTSIQKDAILALTKSATVFVSYLASHANELTSKKTISPQDVLNAIKEIEMNGVMEIGKLGTDGRNGGRLERELEMYEDSVRGKRKGYREKVKARESGVTDADREEGNADGERGEPQKKRVRRTSDDDEADEELLDAQLNGPDSASRVEPDAKSEGPATNGTQRGEDNDETEDDPEIEDDGEEEDLDAPDDDEGEDDQDQEREGEPNDEDDLDNGIDGHARSRMILAPNGRVEVGSEDESD